MQTLLPALLFIAVVVGLVPFAWGNLRRTGQAAEQAARGPRDKPFPARVDRPEQDLGG